MTISQDLEKIGSRVQEKRRNFETYDFGPARDDALLTFFDLAQEYDALENLYRVAVCVIQEFFRLNSRLYLISPENRLELVCDSLAGVRTDKTPPPAYVRQASQAYGEQGSWIVPIRGNLMLVNLLPFYAQEQVMGMLEVFPAQDLSDNDRFFFEKYANRLGYNLHTKLVYWQNIQRIRFVNSLVADIEHNVIIPNISLSLYLRRLRQKIAGLKELECQCELAPRQCLECSLPGKPQERFQQLVQEMEIDYRSLEQHYRGVSLFIESLFRSSHFQRGQFVLRRRKTRVNSEIIQPQLLLYQEKLKERQIDIDTTLGVMPDEDLPLSVDKGLMAQVYANLFSNAVKYSRRNQEGRKYLAYGMDLLKDYFGPGKDGIKFNVFTTGPHVPPEDVPRIFDEGYRGSNVDHEVGTGRGLFFIKNVIETHGGEVGYEATNGGNNFYFVLPMLVTPEAPMAGALASNPDSP
jgi:signal transduction histidine kinase